MRLRSVFEGFRSAFCRFAERVKSFLGWREMEGETIAVAVSMAMEQQDATEQPARSKRGTDDDGDGDGSGSTSSRWHVPDADDEPEPADDAERRRDGFDENDRPINYGDEEALQDHLEHERMRKYFEDEGDEEEDDAEEERKRDDDGNKSDQQHEQQLLHNQRIIANARATKRRQAMTLAEKEAAIQEAIKHLEGDIPEAEEECDAPEPGEKPRKGEGPELD